MMPYASSPSPSPSPPPPSLAILANALIFVVLFVVTLSSAATATTHPPSLAASSLPPPAVAVAFAASPFFGDGATRGLTSRFVDDGEGWRRVPPLYPPLPLRAYPATGETRRRLWCRHLHPALSARRRWGHRIARREYSTREPFSRAFDVERASELRRLTVVAAGIDGDSVGASRMPLPSLFPTDDGGYPLIPAGLRGEAVRAAYSQRSICLNLSDAMNCAVVRVRGRGTRDFLSNKLTNSFPTIDSGGGGDGGVRGACLLTPRGRVVDRLLVPYFLGSKADDGSDDEAYLITSPDVHSYHGNTNNHLFRRLDPLVFPMDRVGLTDLTTTGDDEGGCAVFVVASSDIRRCADLIEDRIVRSLRGKGDASGCSGEDLPRQEGRCKRLTDEEGGGEVIVMYGVDHVLPSNFRGYTVLVRGGGDLCGRAWEELCRDGGGGGGGGGAEDAPLAVGPLEWETLRVEHGLPGVGTEMTAGGGSVGGNDDDDESEEEEGDDGTTSPRVGAVAAPAGPMELNLGSSTVDVDKGCYLGQEGVAAVLKNKRGLPRKLYSVVFDDSDNGDDGDDGIDGAAVASAARTGDELFLLGSNEGISVGKITSVSPEPGGTGRAETVALALVRRADGILGRARRLGLDVGRHRIGEGYGDEEVAGRWGTDRPDTVDDDDPAAVIVDESDPLHGLEVLVGGTDVIGTLRAVACCFPTSSESGAGPSSSRTTAAGGLSGKGSALGDEGPSSVMGYYYPPIDNSNEGLSSEDEDEVARAAAPPAAADGREGVDVAKTEAEAEAEAEAKRKKQKMDMLRKRAAEAMEARRRKKREEREERERNNASVSAPPGDDGTVGEDDADAEARRKAAKMELLRKRADAAMEARRRKRIMQEKEDKT